MPHLHFDCVYNPRRISITYNAPVQFQERVAESVIEEKSSNLSGSTAQPALQYFHDVVRPRAGEKTAVKVVPSTPTYDPSEVMQSFLSDAASNGAASSSMFIDCAVADEEGSSAFVMPETASAEIKDMLANFGKALNLSKNRI